MLGVAVGHLTRRDSDLAQVVEAHGPPPLWARSPGFATLIQIILEQQVSLASAKAVYRRLQASAGRVTPTAVAQLGADGLRSLGFTRQKASYCAALACRVRRRRLDLRRLRNEDDAIVRRELLDVKGIGPWSADVYLLMALGRPDIWPPGDVALLQSMRRVKRLRAVPTADRAERIARGWRPWRSAAARILWHAYLQDRRRR